MKPRKVWTACAMAVTVLVASGCYGQSTAYVGVYGAPYYGPGAWGAYPYPGRYPPYGGSVWVGVPICCEDADRDAEQGADGAVPETPPSAASLEKRSPRGEEDARYDPRGPTVDPGGPPAHDRYN